MYPVHKLGLIEVLVIRLIFTLKAWVVPSLQPPQPHHNHHHHQNDRDHPSKDWTSETLSRLHLSSKSVPGVLEDMEVPDVICDGLRWKWTLKRSFPERFRKIGQQKPCQDSSCHPSLSWSLGGHGGSWHTLWWSSMEVNIQEKLPWKFHEDWTKETLSRLQLSSKSLPGVLEDMEDPDVPGDGLR